MYGVIYKGKKYLIRKERVEEFQRFQKGVKALPKKIGKTLLVLALAYTFLQGAWVVGGQVTDAAARIGRQLELPEISQEDLCFYEGVGC